MVGPLMCALVFGLLNISKGLCDVQVKPSMNPIAVGENVTFDIFPVTSIKIGTWSFASTVIALWLPGSPPEIALNYVDRVMLNSSTGSLFLSSVTPADSGVYNMQGFSPDKLSAQVNLSVQVPVSNVTVTVNATNFVEFNDSVSLTCSASGSSLTFHWFNESSEIIVRDRIWLSNNNQTLIISGVLRSDKGPMYCLVSNGVSNATSKSILFDIRYGPSDINVTVSPFEMAYRTGSDITLSCLSQSNPPAIYYWDVDGKILTQSSSELILRNVQQNQSGNYTCWACNNITLRFASARVLLTIIEPIKWTSINYFGQQPIINQTFTLSCNVSETPISIHWLKNDRTLSPDIRITFSKDNSSITFSSLEFSDNGKYQCEAVNAVSNKTSPGYQLLVNFGPKKPVIIGPSIAETGSVVSLNCSASSQPPSQYSWYFNGTRVANGSVYTTEVLTSPGHGTYTCMAFNSVTERNSSTEKQLTIIDSITRVVINVSGEQPILNHSFVLTCEVTGRDNSILWMKNGQLMFSSNLITFSKDNSSVTFNSLELSDNGKYQCEAVNAVSNKTSPGYQLLVNFGPENPVITGPSIAETGSVVSLNCSASSQPPSQCSWYFNGTRVAQGSVYKTEVLISPGHRTYTCMAFNSVTERNSSTEMQLTIIAALSSVTVRPAPSTPIRFLNLTLTCDVTGSVFAVHWLKGGQHLSLNNRIMLSEDNSSVSFRPVHISDDGNYQCVASNPLNNRTSSAYHLLVNYGPERPVVTGPTTVTEGVTVTLNCSASSQPPSQYYWTFNNGTHFISTGSSLRITHPSYQNAGQYTCVARNVLLNTTSSATVNVSITRPPSTPVTPLLTTPSAGHCQYCGVGLTFATIFGFFLPLLSGWLFL